MNAHGMQQLRRYVPELGTGSGRVRIGLYALGCFLLVTLYFVLSDRIPTWSIDSEIVVMALGFLVLRLFFTRRAVYLAQYGDLAYRRAFARFGIPGLAIVMAAAAHAAYMNGPAVPRGWWTSVFTILGFLLVIVGATLWLRGVVTFGLDNLALLYVYYPAQGRLINSSVYGILRHPVYAGVLRMIIGAALLNGNANSMAFILFAPLGLTGWVRLVEERELIERFGSAYQEYRRRIPAFWPRPRDLWRFIRFLLAGEQPV